MSPVKLGLSIAWPAFWTGIPIKCILVLLLLAMGVHPWEMPGLAILLVLSIPIDIWALNVTAKTVFLERLSVRPPESIGLTLWWQLALMSAVYLPIAYVIESQVVAMAKSITASIMALLQSIPVAERISIELVLWSSVATAVLLILVLGWLYLVGWIVRKQVSAAPPADAPYPALVRQWDLMRVPVDQPLLLAAFTASGALLVLLFWAVMPVMTPHPHEDYKEARAKAEKVHPPIRPAETLQKTEKLIAQAETTVEALEAKAQAESKDPKEKDKGKGSANAPVTKVQPVSATKAEPAKAAKKDLGAGKTDSREQADDGHKH